MHSSAGSNSVPIQPPGTTWSYADSTHDGSETSAQNDGPLRFKVRLYDDYKDTAVLPELHTLGGTDRWITVRTQFNRSYKIKMVNDGAGFLLQRGWPLLVAIENLQEGQTLMFEHENIDVFRVWIHTPLNHPPPAGLSPARIPPPDNTFGLTHLVIDPGTQMNETVIQGIQQVWNATSVNGPIYVCRLLTNPAEDNSLMFNKVYSYLIPEDSANIAMRFVGSNVIIPGAMKTYDNRRTHIIKAWPLYAKEHNLAAGETFICKVHRGPTAWEFIGFCAART